MFWNFMTLPNSHLICFVYHDMRMMCFLEKIWNPCLKGIIQLQKHKGCIALSSYITAETS